MHFISILNVSSSSLCWLCVSLVWFLYISYISMYILNLFSMVFLMKLLIRNKKKKKRKVSLCITLRTKYQASYSRCNYLLFIYYGKIVKRGWQSSCYIQCRLIIRSSSNHHVPAYSKMSTEKSWVFIATKSYNHFNHLL